MPAPMIPMSILSSSLAGSNASLGIGPANFAFDDIMKSWMTDVEEGADFNSNKYLILGLQSQQNITYGTESKQWPYEDW